ncbi:hypothetical protein ABW19_dt0208144 [Dactylella cylindrospora]|nr:hypothetical protein ABW19_dt0208144 [Dactylella cylindrospora]
MSSKGKGKLLSCDDYTIGWICALPLEMTAARCMLDVVHPDIPFTDGGSYAYGSIAGHNIVIAGLPKGATGTTSVAVIAQRMLSTFRSIKFGILAGIGGGVPSRKHDIRLGDVVVSSPTTGTGGVIQWDFGKTVQGGVFEPTGMLNRPPNILLEAITNLESIQAAEGNKIMDHISTMIQRYPLLAVHYSQPSLFADNLYQANYDHPEEEETCFRCDPTRRIPRFPPRFGNRPVVHYGLIASGNQVMKHGSTRDIVSKRFGGVLCFEMEAAGLMNDFPCVVIRGISDYADSHKNDVWQHYAAATAAGYTKELLNKIPVSSVEGIKGISQARFGTTTSLAQAENERSLRTDPQKYLQMLNKTNIKEQLRRNPPRKEGTCRWFLQNEKYHQWLDSDESNMLWVTADAGCGKSVLAKSLIEGEIQSTEYRTTCHFFFKNDNPDHRKAPDALCALLYQLFAAKQDLLENALPRLQAGDSRLSESIEDLWDILEVAASHPNSGQIICVLDALDECEEESRYKLIALLKRFYLKPSLKTNLKFLITSRRYSDIERHFRGLTSLCQEVHLAGEEESDAISQEIDIVIRSRVRELARDKNLPVDIAVTLENRLLSKRHRTYLWIKLIFEILGTRDDVTTTKRARNILDEMPDTVEAAYEELLNRSKDSRTAMKVLQIITVARRPLTITEMKIALAVSESTKSYDDLDLESDDLFRTRIRNACGLFVTIVDRKLYLIHETAREFLVREDADKLPEDPQKWRGSIALTDAHLTLAEACLSYLMFDDFERSPLPFASAATREPLYHFLQGYYDVDDMPLDTFEAEYNAAVECYIREHAFLEYASESWYRHVAESEAYTISHILTVISALMDGTSERALTWFRINFHLKFSGSFSVKPHEHLIFETSCELDQIPALLLIRGNRPNSPTGYWPQRASAYWALRRASRNLDLTTVSKLQQIFTHFVDSFTYHIVTTVVGHLVDILPDDKVPYVQPNARTRLASNNRKVPDMVNNPEAFGGKYHQGWSEQELTICRLDIVRYLFTEFIGEHPEEVQGWSGHYLIALVCFEMITNFVMMETLNFRRDMISMAITRHVMTDQIAAAGFSRHFRNSGPRRQPSSGDLRVFASTFFHLAAADLQQEGNVTPEGPIGAAIILGHHFLTRFINTGIPEDFHSLNLFEGTATMFQHRHPALILILHTDKHLYYEDLG